MSEAVDVLVIGDGPGGLSAALFLAKNGKQVVIFGEDKTAMHAAFLHNYLGLPSTSGSEFQRIARAQVADRGAVFRPVHVDALEQTAEGQFAAQAGGATINARYVILSEGKAPKLARALGLTFGTGGEVVVDRNGRTSMPNVYVVGRSARPQRSQAIISAGDGAAAALDILSIESGKDVADWDTP